MKKRQLLIGVAFLSVMGFILYQGTRNLDQSLAYSDQIVYGVMNWWFKDSMLSSEEVMNWYPYVNFIVRKAAHFTEYGVLGAVSTLLWRRQKQTTLDLMVYAFLGVMSLAILDEYLQLYSGRGSMVSDVLIDSAGGLVGIQLTMLGLWLFKKEPVVTDRRQWAGESLADLIRWSERHVFVEQQGETYQVLLITPDGTQAIETGDWVLRLTNGTYRVDSMKQR